jgi:hypothetical protein
MLHKTEVTKILKMRKKKKTVGELISPIKNEMVMHYLRGISKGDWVKVYEAGIKDGNRLEVHYFRNVNTGEVFDVKVKCNYFHQKEFNELIK